MYIAAKFFNMFSPGDEVEAPNPKWIESGLVQQVESKEKFMEMVDAKDTELLDALDPEKPVKRGKAKSEDK